jgi:carbon storage regulator CsrA
MLVLTRKNQESVVVGGVGGMGSRLKVTVLEINGGRVKLGFEANSNVSIHRWEVWERILFNPNRMISDTDRDPRVDE